jgi:hypothetical protein
VTGTALNVFEKNGVPFARVEIMPRLGDAYREPFVCLPCSPSVQIGDTVSFDAFPFDVVGDRELLRATDLVVVRKADGSVPPDLTRV